MAGHSNLTLARLSLAVAALALAACGTQPAAERFLGVITPYRIDIVQGNVVTSEQAAAVRPGMTRAQVRDILGSPMLADIFHADRWDYVFTIQRPGAEPQRRAIVAHFKDDRLERLDAPDLPSERDFVATISPARRSGGKAPNLELTDEQRKALPVPKAVPAQPAAPAAPARAYPPLEPA